MKNMNRVHDLTGERFGRLVVIGLDDKNTRKTYWVCQCDCGETKTVRSDALLSGATVSCGCKKKEQNCKNLTAGKKHYMSGTRLYMIWQGMKARCYNVHNARYHSYGGRGITICDEWKNSFESFMKWAYENGYDDSLTIDRKDNDGNYEPQNCQWATIKEQVNNRRSNIKITIGNATKTLSEWCEIFEVDFNTVNARYHAHGFIGIDDLFNG